MRWNYNLHHKIIKIYKSKSLFTKGLKNKAFIKMSNKNGEIFAWVFSLMAISVRYKFCNPGSIPSVFRTLWHFKWPYPRLAQNALLRSVSYLVYAKT